MYSTGVLRPLRAGVKCSKVLEYTYHYTGYVFSLVQTKAMHNSIVLSYCSTLNGSVVVFFFFVVRS
jgi:hypothetical protein